MQNRRNRLCVLLAAAGMSLAASSAQADDHKQMTVQVKQGVVRQSPAALGKVEYTLDYGQRVNVLEKSGESWVKIQAVDDANKTGWMRAGELTPRKLKLQTSQAGLSAPAGATASEIAMAGKGFNQQVEGDYRKVNNTRGYEILEQIDAKPQFNVDPASVPAFQQAGGVIPQEGK